MREPHRYASIPEGKFNDLILTLDLIDAGFAGWLMRLPPQRQQIMFAVLAKAAATFLRLRPEYELAHRLLPEALVHLRPVATQMRRGRSRDLICEHFHSCPDGLLGALQKTRGGPQGGAYYIRLHRIFSDPDQRRLAKLIRYLPSLDLHRLNVLTALDPIFWSGNFAAKVRTVEQAGDLGEALALLRDVVGVTDEALRSSISGLGPRTTISEWIRGWLRHATHVPCPCLDLGCDWLALDTAQKLFESSLRNRNCLSQLPQLVSALSGARSFFENQRLGVLVEIRALGPQRHLALAGVFGPENARVPIAVRKRAEQDFAQVGIFSLYGSAPPSRWDVLRRLGMSHAIDELDLAGLETEEVA